MRILIDTNRYTDFCKNDNEAVLLVQKSFKIYIPLIVLGELRAGFACGSRGSENERSLIRFLNSPRVKIMAADEDTTHQYARLYRQLRTAGTPIPTNDLWIASLACQHDLPVFTRDVHFSKLPQLVLV